LNLQSCETVINYDLPWNPQRIEQRIGRCPRYSQQRDVTVVNIIVRQIPHFECSRPNESRTRDRGEPQELMDFPKQQRDALQGYAPILFSL